MTSRNFWIPFAKEGRAVSQRVFALPFAGGSSLAFRSFERLLQPDVELCAIELPGHGTRMNEGFETQMSTLIVRIAEGIQDRLELPFCLFGHSMGATIAYELGHYLQKKKGKSAQCLILSGMRAPFLSNPEPPMSALPDDRFIERLRSFGGTPPGLFEQPDLLKMFLEVSRADFRIFESYSPTVEPIDIPIHAFGGDADPYVQPDEVRAWSQMTTSQFEYSEFPGSHFFLFQFVEPIAEIMNQKLKSQSAWSRV